MKLATTIIADASLCPDTGVGGWAAWMIGNGLGSAIFGGRLREKTKSSSEAELMALANALHVAVMRGYATQSGATLLQSDSIDALAYLRRRMSGMPDRPHPEGLAVPVCRKAPRSENARHAVELIANLASAHGLHLAVRHVKGHIEGGGRHWVNGRCDEMAKMYMREAREAFRAREDSEHFRIDPLTHRAIMHDDKSTLTG